VRHEEAFLRLDLTVRYERPSFPRVLILRCEGVLRLPRVLILRCEGEARASKERTRGSLRIRA
jgi:hypothetical protein